MTVLNEGLKMRERNIWLNKNIGWFFLIILMIAAGARKLYGFKGTKQKEPQPIIVEVEVRKNWCLLEIAQDLGTDWRQIAELNNLKDPNLILPGQKLKVIPFNQNNIVKVSWYGKKFHGKPMADGKKTPFNMYNPTIAAQKWLPIGTKVLLTCIDTKKSIVVIVRDRGPYHKDRCFDLSWAAAKQLDIIEMGVANCEVKILN